MNCSNNLLILLPENDKWRAIERSVRHMLEAHHFRSEQIVVQKMLCSDETILTDSQRECQPINHFDFVIVMGAKRDLLNYLDQKWRAIKPNYKLIIGDANQFGFYLFTDFGSEFGHLSFEKYLSLNGDHLIEKLYDNSANLDSIFNFFAIIMAGIIIGPIISNNLNNFKQFVSYSFDTRLVSRIKDIKDTPVIVVGCGALGFQIVKNLVEIGVQYLILIDNDCVHRFNVNNNYFSENDIGMKKCDIIKNYALKLNENLRIEVLYVRIQELGNTFFENTLQTKSIIMSAVDDINAKRYINKICLNHSLPFIDVGVESFMFHIQSIVPHITESYFTVSDSPELDFPLCVIKSFPHNIEQCIEWAKLKFESWFNKNPKRVNVWSDCVKIARIQFEKLYCHKAKQLLYSIPLDRLNDDGTNFWSEKNIPKHIDFDINNNLHISFVICFAQLLAKVNRIFVSEDENHIEFIKNIINSTDVPEFVPKQNKVIETDPTVTSSNNNGRQNNNDINCQMYSKDDETQLNLISYLSNLRALMYSIPTISLKQISRYYYKSIPCSFASIMTASAIASNELIKLLNMNGKYDREETYFNNKNYFVNLSSFDQFIESEVGRVKLSQLSSSLQFTEWDCWHIYESDSINTLEDVLNHLKEKTGLNCSMLVMDDSKSIYLPDLFPHHTKRKKQSMRDIINTYYTIIPKFVTLTVSYDNECNDDISGPNVKFFFNLI